jgi:hypothetical protein
LDLLDLDVCELENELGVENPKARLNIFRALEALQKRHRADIPGHTADRQPCDPSLAKSPENPHGWSTEQVSEWLNTHGCEDAVEVDGVMVMACVCVCVVCVSFVCG